MKLENVYDDLQEFNIEAFEWLEGIDHHTINLNQNVYVRVNMLNSLVVCFYVCTEGDFSLLRSYTWPVKRRRREECLSNELHSSYNQEFTVGEWPTLLQCLRRMLA